MYYWSPMVRAASMFLCTFDHACGVRLNKILSKATVDVTLWGPGKCTTEPYDTDISQVLPNTYVDTIHNALYILTLL